MPLLIKLNQIFFLHSIFKIKLTGTGPSGNVKAVKRIGNPDLNDRIIFSDPDSNIIPADPGHDWTFLVRLTRKIIMSRNEICSVLA